MAAWLLALLLSSPAAFGQAADDAVTVTALRDPVDKSYRRMVDGMDLFEMRRRELAPGATLRFKLLPRHRRTNMENVTLAIVGDSFETPLALAPDNTFTLPRDAKALKEDASVRPNRRSGTMTWRAEIRSPGVPAGARRLGDLRLECEVGMQARLISNGSPGLFGSLVDAMIGGPSYCHEEAPRYLFFADRPLWQVTLAHGKRREALSVDRMYASAAVDPDWKAKLPYCDCEVLLDRTYFMPLGDASWPHDTLVTFEYMDEPPAPSAKPMTRAGVQARFGPPARIAFDNGHAVWVYREPLEKEQASRAELVLLFAPTGEVAKARLRRINRPDGRAVSPLPEESARVP